MNNYAVIIRVEQSGLQQAECVQISEQDFLAITAIIHGATPAPLPDPEPEAPLRVKITWPEGVNVRSDHVVNSTNKVGSLPLNKPVDVVETWIPDGMNEWCYIRVPLVGWFARIYQGSVKGIYV